jgi:hypothetical protein
MWITYNEHSYYFEVRNTFNLNRFRSVQWSYILDERLNFLDELMKISLFTICFLSVHIYLCTAFLNSKNECLLAN